MANFLKSLAKSKNEIFVPHLNNWFARGVFPDELPLAIHPNKRPDKFFHPSGHCVPCARSLFAELSGELSKDPLDASSHKIFFTGHYWHALLQYAAVDMGFATWDDVEVSTGAVGLSDGVLPWSEYDPKKDEPYLWRAKGSADLIVDLPGHGRVLVDFKTMHSMSFKGDLNPVLYQKYEYQMWCYMHWLGISKCVLVGIQKDSPHDFKEIVVDFDEFDFDMLSLEVYDKWDTVAVALKKDYPPDCNCPVGKCPVGHIYV